MGRIEDSAKKLNDINASEKAKQVSDAALKKDQADKIDTAYANFLTEKAQPIFNKLLKTLNANSIQSNFLTKEVLHKSLRSLSQPYGFFINTARPIYVCIDFPSLDEITLLIKSGGDFEAGKRLKKKYAEFDYNFVETEVMNEFDKINGLK